MTTTTEIITVEGIEVEVIFDYQPYEPSTRDYPGCGESFEDIHVLHAGEEITDLLSDKVMKEIEDKL